MAKPLPDWDIYLKLPTLKPQQAVALSFGIDPDKVSSSDRYGKSWGYKTSGWINQIGGFSERLMLLKACHPSPMSPTDFSSWAQSVEWNIPLELAALAPTEPVELVPLPTDAVIQALSEIVASGVSSEVLLSEVLKVGVKFISDNGESIAVIPDGTVMGHRVGFKHLRGSLPHSVDHLIRSSGASGGGMGQSVPAATPVQIQHATMPRMDMASLLKELAAPSDTPAQPVAINPDFISLREVLLRLQNASNPALTFTQAAHILLSLGFRAGGAPEWKCNGKKGIVSTDAMQTKCATDRIEYVYHRGQFESDDGNGASTDYELFGFNRREFSEFITQHVGDSLDLDFPLTDTAPAKTPERVVADSDVKPWLLTDPKDPSPNQHWYTPARYFARQLVIKDSTLLIKRLVLADKVSQSLAGAGIFKRGGKKSHSPDTILKAFANVTLG